MHEPGFGKALQQMRRALKRDGRAQFVEHGTSPGANVRRWQDQRNPLRHRVAGVCNLTWGIPRLDAATGFGVERPKRMDMRGTPTVSGLQHRGAVTPQ